ncbi:hypothetical protein C3369_07645 [Escherichia sp. ESNIH1]|uniref:hypothetical protein n=1 Tax=Escherichia sp. ESNIH1 TaxID=1985876 RepID=UPI000CDDCAE8|nr:hypothetical protein [Escherichia sp. ESNIH1]POU02331.1 hypothetical protein C3369_07645 [Escherichia sp. ESNIH1]
MNTNKPKLVAGQGVNDIEYSTKNYPLAYKSWTNMLERAYSSRFHLTYPSYKGCTVCDEWLKFSNYLKWWQVNHRKNYQADKDLLIPGNREYGPDTVRFVPSYVNNVLLDKAAKRGGYALGVVKNQKNNTFTVYCNQLGRKHYQASGFTSEAKAHKVWQEAKIVAIELVIARYRTEPFPLPEIIAALQARIAVLKSDIQNNRITVKL